MKLVLDNEEYYLVHSDKTVGGIAFDESGDNVIALEYNVDEDRGNVIATTATGSNLPKLNRDEIESLLKNNEAGRTAWSVEISKGIQSTISITKLS